jgi:hypothetical protein
VRIIVTTQAELDAALDQPGDQIVIDSPAGVWLNVTGSATVRAWGSATVRASGSATVRASAFVAVYLHGAKVTHEGGVVIDVSALDLDDAETWCAYHGVAVVDGVATLYKAVDSGWSTARGTSYRPGSAPVAADWRDDHECGGGLHLSPLPSQAAGYFDSVADDRPVHYVRVGVALATLRPIDGRDIWVIPKAKAPAVVVACVEVDGHGREVVS